MSYAEKTTVSAESSRTEIERTLIRYGADQFMYGWNDHGAVIQFRAQDRYVKFVLPMPSKTERRFTHHSRGVRTADAALKEWEQETRRRWRALALAVKAKLEVVASGISTFEDEFMANRRRMDEAANRRRVHVGTDAGTDAARAAGGRGDRVKAATPLREILERDWDRQLFAGGRKPGLATQLGWHSHWTFTSKGSAHGFPDRTLARDRIVFVELKRELTGRRSEDANRQPTPAQVVWLDRLAAAGAEVYLWRPSDLDKIAQILTARQRPEHLAVASVWLLGIGRADTPGRHAVETVHMT